MALIVLSRPDFIVYYPLIIFFIISSMKPIQTKNKIKDCIFILVPLGIFAILQMIYNFIRFDNVLEFGARYQLTSFDMNYCMSFTFGKIYQGLLLYIFKLPIIDPFHIPFVYLSSNTSLVNMNEICYENKLIGLIAIPILWIFLFKKYIYNDNSSKNLKIFTNINIITCIISIIITTCMAGITENYSVGFKLILCINAILLLLKFVENKNNSNEVNKLFLILCIVSIFIMLPITFGEQYSILTNTFEFWR